MERLRCKIWRVRKITTPRKNEIIEKATELWRQDRIRANDPSFDIIPELCELEEEGYISAAQSELMRSEGYDWKIHLEQQEEFSSRSLQNA